MIKHGHGKAVQERRSRNAKRAANTEYIGALGTGRGRALHVNCLLLNSRLLLLASWLLLTSWWWLVRLFRAGLVHLVK